MALEKKFFLRTVLYLKRTITIEILIGLKIFKTKDCLLEIIFSDCRKNKKKLADSI